ncbi:MAG: AAA family ATPase [Rhodocyclaceae bacterium]|nr:AAA family ATPase [Rhodocyclaceae bacterium]
MYREQLVWLDRWARRPKHKPLILRGARQVGKSTLVSLFAQRARLKLVSLNFERTPEHATVFASKDAQQIINLLALLLNQTIIPGESLLFLDEIQAQPVVLGALRYFYEELPDLHVIAAGSLLDFELPSPQFSMPVGRVSYLHLGPMNFTEFLAAVNKDKLAQFVKTWQIGVDIPSVLHSELMVWLRRYLAVGGMPEAVDAFAKTGNYKECEEIKQDLLATFSDDFSKYAKQHDQDLIRTIFKKIPAMVGQKIKYASISRDRKSADVARGIQQLCQARVMTKVIHSAANGLPLSAEENPSFFKGLFLDVGLVSSMLNLSYQALQSEDLMAINAGALAEQFVGQALLHSLDAHETPFLHYWAREQRSSSAEVDFVIAVDRYVIPIEVKSGKTGSLKSLHLFLKEKQSRMAVRFNADLPSVLHDISLPAGEQYLVSLPLYMAGECRRVVSEMDAVSSGIA